MGALPDYTAHSFFIHPDLLTEEFYQVELLVEVHQVVAPYHRIGTAFVEAYGEKRFELPFTLIFQAVTRTGGIAKEGAGITAVAAGTKEHPGCSQNINYSHKKC